ncbi:hypothetical protein GM418_20810 [Maribellus comscasis]|uniref:Cupin domain-containing protein n=1 Tax=Maribellus comscasis TaxID=2681766 RepID=A0A6I6JU22_9BACT|nr:hypothetical protein [Maribellus comscasis]QGY46021.1 hypothetical protein GM418_20810 [Maribellus comscasis]
MNLRKILTVIIVFGMIQSYAQKNMEAEVKTLQLEENGNFPNNSGLPVLLYKDVFRFEGKDPASNIERVFDENNWGGSWRNGIYNFQHYHSTAHEALGVYGGWAEVQLGGSGSEIVRIEKGDLVVLPVGTAHKRIDSGDGFAVVGAYPDGQQWDMNYGKAEEVQPAKENISKVKLPENDPVFGRDGKMFEFWK